MTDTKKANAKDDATPEVPKGPSMEELVAAHPLADRISRAVKAHPVLKGEKKLVVGVEEGRAHLSGTVFTLDMYRQLIDLLKRIGDEDTEVIFEVEPEMKLPVSRVPEGQVPAVSPGAGAAKRNFSVHHLPERG